VLYGQRSSIGWLCASHHRRFPSLPAAHNKYYKKKKKNLCDAWDRGTEVAERQSPKIGKNKKVF
jgi:hypothetical protein